MMKLKKDMWKTISVGDVVNELRITTDNPYNQGIEHYIGFEHIESENLQIKQFGDIDDGVNFNKIFRKGDVLFGKIRAYLKKVAVAPFDGLCSGDILVLRTKDENTLSQNLLPYVITTNDFYKLAIDSSIGTTMPRTKWQYLSKHVFPLPPLDEQERIVELFQSIEQAIVHAERQEKNLKSLQKTLSNGLASNPPVFGNLLADKKTFKVFKTSEVLECIEEHDRTPLEHGLTRFVGLENIEAENFALQGFGNIKDGTTFTKRFSKGDVLFGKRRAYLKKVAVADYDGICSSDILVFRAIKEKILPELLPYYVSSDSFINHAVSTSAGSLSPRTKWRDLAGFQLAIPDVKTQEKMVDVFSQSSQSLRLLGKQKETLKKLKQKLLNEILG
ncbi:restriction endonuclease subunit S [candidate division KSB1 bacterium]|nr:restriction endonuclease subunit S [candidate division KSB1 bacterium]